MMIIKLVNDSVLRQQVVEFTAAEIWRRWKTQPTPPPILFAAFEGRRILGSLGLTLCECNTAPFAPLYQLADPAQVSAQVLGPSVIYGRWLALRPGVSIPLSFAATKFAKDQGRRHGWCVVKPGVASIMRRAGIKLTFCPTRFSPAHVPAGDRRYYLSDPQPEVYLLGVHQVLVASGKITRPLIRAGKLEIRYGD